MKLLQRVFLARLADGATHGRLVRGSGLVPFVDLGSRQLRYAYLIAAFVG
jgi:hypothetical protein